MNFIVSGGVSSIQDVQRLNAQGMSGVIIGRAIYEEKISLQELRRLGLDDKKD